MGDTRKLSVAVVLGFVAAASTWSYAGTLPNYSFTIESPNPFQVLGSPVPLFNTQSATYGSGIGTAIDSVAVGDGFVGSDSYAALSYPSPPFNGGIVVAQTASAEAVIPDLYLVGPAGGTVDFSLNLSVNGSISASGDDGQASAYFFAFVSSPSCSVSVTGSIAVDSGGGYSASGMFAGGPDWSGSTPECTGGRNGDYITITLDLSTTALASVSGTLYGDYGVAAQGHAGFLDPAMFSDIGSLFNFSAPGWTVDSTDGCVENNQYLCAPAGPSAPEPASSVLLGTVLAGVGLFRRRLRTTQSQAPASWCQGRSKVRPLGRRESRPLHGQERFWFEGFTRPAGT